MPAIPLKAVPDCARLLAGCWPLSAYERTWLLRRIDAGDWIDSDRATVGEMLPASLCRLLTDGEEISS